MIIAEHTYFNATTFSFAFNELNIKAADIHGILGYNPEEAPDQVREDLKNILQIAGDYCDIRGGVRLFDDLKISGRQDIILQDVEFAAGKIIAKQLRDANSAALFACTIGDGLEKWSRELMAGGDFLKGYIVDAVASVAVEAATDMLQNRLEKMAQGKKASNRYSPGYCGWDVAEQQKLFSLLPPEFCGISLSPSSLMSPIKSVSGLIGLGENIERVDYTCRFCDMKNCVYRKHRERS